MNATTTILDIINRAVLYLKRDFSETEFCLRNALFQLQDSTIDNVQNSDSYFTIIAAYCEHYMESENKFYKQNADFLMLSQAVHRATTLF
jgi:hypothetical protein